MFQSRMQSTLLSQATVGTRLYNGITKDTHFKFLLFTDNNVPQSRLLPVTTSQTRLWSPDADTRSHFIDSCTNYSTTPPIGPQSQSDVFFFIE